MKSSVEIWRVGLEFDGNAQAIQLFENDLLVGQGACAFTLEAWVCPSVKRDMTILSFGASSGDVVTLGIGADGYFEVMSSGQRLLQSHQPAKSAEWQHVAVSTQGKELTLYLDGQVSAGPLSRSLELRMGEAWIGARALSMGTERAFFAGKLAEVRSWGRDRTPAQIRELMRTRPLGDEADLTGWWSLESARNPGRDSSLRLRTGLPTNGAPFQPAFEPVCGTLPVQSPVELVRIGDVVGATSFHHLLGRLNGGITLTSGLGFPLQVLLEPLEGVINPYQITPTRFNYQDAERMPSVSSPVDLWEPSVLLKMDCPPIPLLSMTALGELLTEEDRAQLSETELSLTSALKLRDAVLVVNRTSKRLEELNLEFVLQASWDLGRPWLDRENILVLRNPGMLMEVESPLALHRDVEFTFFGQVVFGSGILELAAEVPNLAIRAEMLQGTRIYLREVLELFDVDTLPDGFQQMALSDLGLEANLRRRTGSFRVRISDVWQMTLAGRSFGVEELFFAVRGGRGRSTSADLGGILDLAGVAVGLRAYSTPGRGWTFQGQLAGDMTVGNRTLKSRLPLGDLLESLLEDVGAPLDLPRLDLTQLSLTVTPATGAFSVKAGASFDLALDDTQLTIHEVEVEISQASRTQGISASLKLVMSGCIEEVLTLERFTLSFSYSSSTRRWALEGAINARFLEQLFMLTASLYTEPTVSGLRLSLKGAEIAIPAGDSAQLGLGLRYLDVLKRREDQKAKWEVTATVALSLKNMPEQVLKVLPAETFLTGGFKSGKLTLKASRLLAAQVFDLTSFDPNLGQMSVDLRDLTLGLGSDVELSGELFIGLPSRLNHLFGVRADDTPKMKIFRTYDPNRKDEGLTRLKLGFNTQGGLYAQLKNSPFEGVMTSGETWHFDLGDCGAIQLTAPTIQSNGAGFSMSGTLQIDETRGLWLPLTPLQELFKQADMPEVAKAIPSRFRLDEIKVTNDQGQLDLQKFLGVPREELPKEVLDLMEGLSDLTDKLPSWLTSYLNVKLKSLKFGFSVDAAGNMALDLRTPDDAPLKLLLPGFPLLTGVELRRLTFGPIVGGSLFRLDVDADVHSIDFITLLLMMVIDEKAFGNQLPARDDIRRTLYLNDVFMIIVYQTGIPIPLPLLFRKLGYHYVGIEGIKSSVQLYFTAPKPDSDGRPQLNIAEIVKLLTHIRRYFTEADFYLSKNKAPEGLNLIMRVDAAYLTLPEYLGGKTLGITQPEEVINVYKTTAGLLDTIKSGSLRYLLEVTPLDRRINKVTLSVCDVLNLETGWVLATPAECVSRKTEIAALLNKLNNESQEVSSEEVLALMPTRSSQGVMVNPVWDEADPDGLVVILTGQFKLGEVLGMKSLFLLKASGVSGFTTALQFKGTVADLLSLELKGLLQVSKGRQSGYLLAGSSSLGFLGREVLYGEFALGDTFFYVAGHLDLFPPESPIAIRGNLSGRLDQSSFELKGAAELTLLGLPMIAGDLEIITRKAPNEFLNYFRVQGALMGSHFYLMLRQDRSSILAEGECSPLCLGPFLTVVRSAEDTTHGPRMFLQVSGLDTVQSLPTRSDELAHLQKLDGRLELQGAVKFLGLTLEANLHADRDGLRFHADADFLLGWATLDCLLSPERGFESHASFELGAKPVVVQYVDEQGVEQTRECKFEGYPAIRVELDIRMLKAPGVERLEERLLPHLSLLEHQKRLWNGLRQVQRLSQSGGLSHTTRRELEGFMANMSALRDTLGWVRELYLGLSLPGSGQLPMSELVSYREAIGATIRYAEQGAQQTRVLNHHLSHECALWTELEAGLKAIAQAAVQGMERVKEVEVAETTLEAHVNTWLDRLFYGVQHPMPQNTYDDKAEIVAQILVLLGTRGLYPDQPLKQSMRLEHVDGFCSGPVLAHKQRMEQELTQLAAQPQNLEVSSWRQRIQTLLAQRPLGPGRLSFVGLATPYIGEESYQAQSSEDIAQDPQQRAVSFSMSLTLSMGTTGNLKQVAGLSVLTAPTDLAQELPGLILKEAALAVVGYRNELPWLDTRLQAHAHARLEQRARLLEQGSLLRRYCGMTVHDIQAMLKGRGYGEGDVQMLR